MRKLLLITGDLAAGKSTLANALGARYRAIVLCKDDCKEALADAVGFADRAENRALSIAAVRIMGHVFSRVAQTGADCVLEANFRGDELRSLLESAAAAEYAARVVVLRGDAAVLHARYLRRAAQGRHPAHLSAPLLRFEDFRAALEAQRAEALPAGAMIVDAGDFSSLTAPAFLEALDSFMG